MKVKKYVQNCLLAVVALLVFLGIGWQAEGSEALVGSMTVKGDSGEANRTVKLQVTDDFWKELLPETGNRLVFLASHKEEPETVLGELALASGSGIFIPAEEAGGNSYEDAKPENVTGAGIEAVTGAGVENVETGTGSSITCDKASGDSYKEYSVCATGAVGAYLADVTGGSITCSIDVSKAGKAYGTWKLKAVLRNESTGDKALAEGGYEVAPVLESFAGKKSKALEKKSAFSVSLKGLKNVYGISSVTFEVYDADGNKAVSVSGKKKASGQSYDAEISLKELGYQLGIYTVKAVLTDQNGSQQTLKKEASLDECADGGTLSVEKKGKGISLYRLKDAYIPGNIKKVTFTVYSVNGEEEKEVGTYKAKKYKNNIFKASVKKEEKGSYKVCAYGTTAWGKQILLNQKTYQLKQKDMGKNGWYYEKYNGKKYKFYYINDVKQTDLTKILDLKESNAKQGSNLLIEINRAASNVTIYLYNEETKKYDIPVKTCAVSVGRDIYTNAGTSGLNTSSSYTPLGDYSICTNGTAVKYTLKPMYEPNGSTVYARWCTHIVGNVYFHAIAVGSQSHYALNPYTYNRLGSPASAGCIRMTVADAKWIYDYAPTGTKIKIKKGDSKHPGPLGKGKTIKSQSGISYDPTDPEVPDSRKKADYKAGKISGYMTKDGERVGY